MSDTLSFVRMKAMFRKLRRWSLSEGIPVLRFIWHGGEPMLLPVDYFERILDLEDRMLGDVHYTNSIQSNLSVPLGNDYIRFLVQNDFKVGMSFDVINTARDPDNRHKATILKNLNRFSRYGSVPGAITVVSRYNVAYPHLLFDFYLAHGVNAHFNRAGSFLRTRRNLYVTVSEYSDFMEKLFLMWKDKGFRGFKLGNIVDMAKKLVRPERNSMCFFDRSCIYGRIHIALNGDVYPCDNLVDRRELIYGNLYDPSFHLGSIFSADNPVLRIFEKRAKMMEKRCASCCFYPNCHGGCPNDAIRSGASFFSKTDQCPHYKRMFNLIKPYASRIVEAAG